MVRKLANAFRGKYHRDPTCSAMKCPAQGCRDPARKLLIRRYHRELAPTNLTRKISKITWTVTFRRWIFVNGI